MAAGELKGRQGVDSRGLRREGSGERRRRDEKRKDR